MKKIVALLLAAVLLCACTGALAGATFTLNAYMGFKGEKLTVRVNYDGKDRAKILTICDENGVVIGQRELSSSKGYWNIETLLPADAPAGQTITMYIDGVEQDTALLAAETRPGYSIVRVDRDDKKVAITFDAANAASKTAQILDVLDKYGAKCTFFVIGRYVVNNPDLTREIEARGHELAGHSWDHPDMPSLNNDQILKERDRAIARALGQEVIKWTVDSRDGFQDTTLNTVIKRVQNNAGSGDIVLMHVYGKHTIAALETLIPWYQEQGFELVTVSDLLLEGDTVIDTDGVQQYRVKETENQ